MERKRMEPTRMRCREARQARRATRALVRWHTCRHLEPDGLLPILLRMPCWSRVTIQACREVRRCSAC